MNLRDNPPTISEPAAPPQRFANNSSLSHRAVGAVFVFVPTLAAALAGGWWFTALVFAIALAATLEVHQLLRFAGIASSRVIGVASFAAAFGAVRLPAGSWALPAVTIVLMATLAWQMKRAGKAPIIDWATSTASGLYLGATSAHLALLREIPNGFWWIFLAVGATWVADSGAYFIGKRWGRHKLAPVISPKKTWEGYVGGIVSGVLFGLVVGLLTPIGLWRALPAALLVSALGTLGDLGESMFKRQANAKDSGNLIPGMGGAFDRIDSLLWAGVIAWLVATLTGPG